MPNDSLDDLLADAVDQLRADECHALAEAVEIARRRLTPPAVSEVRLSIEPDEFEDPATGQLVLCLAEACHASR